MATYVTNLNTFSLADAATGFSELAAPHSSGSAPGSTTENFIHNAVAIDQASGNATGQGAGHEFVGGTLSPAWSAASNWVLSGWAYYASPTNLVSWANGGLRIGIGSAADTYDLFNAMGVDFGNYPYGGWQNTAIDPEFATPDQTIGGGSGTPYLSYCILPNATAKISKGSPIGSDAFRYGRHDIEATGMDVTLEGVAAANDATTARWGVFQETAGGYLFKGLLSLGTAAAVCWTNANGFFIQIDDTPRVLAGFNRIEVRNAGSNITLANITITAPLTSITGSAPVSKGDFEHYDGATLTIESCRFINMGTFDFVGGATLSATTFKNCGLITASGMLILDCAFREGTASSQIITPDISGIFSCSFYSKGTGNAIEWTGVAQAASWDCQLFGYDIGSAGNGVEVTGASITGDEAIHITAVTGIFTINVNSGADIPSVSSAGATVNVVAGAVQLSVQIVDEAGDALTGTSVSVYADGVLGTLPFEDAVTISNSGTTATVTHTAHGLESGELVLIEGGDQPHNRGVFTITVTDVDTYTYTAQGTPSGNPTGCTATWTAIHEALDGSTSVVALNKTYVNDTSVVGQVRKSTTAPYYKTAVVSGTINKSTGLSLTARLSLDQ